MKQLSKILLIFILSTLIIASHITQINENQLDQIKKQKTIWLVYSSQGTYLLMKDPSDQNTKIIQQISQILHPFFKVGFRLQDKAGDVLTLYGDDQYFQQYNGPFNINQIVDFALKTFNDILKIRAKVASDAKANKQFIQKQAQRAAKQWNDEQQLRKKSDVLILTQQNWQSHFLKQRDAYFINFYQANCSTCIQLNQQWQKIADTFKGKAKIAKINMTSSQKLQSSNKLITFPTIRYYSIGTKSTDVYQQFLGIKKKFSIIQWATHKLSQKKLTTQLPQLNKNTYKTMCKQSKSTCIIIFTNTPNQIQNKVQQLAAKHLKKPIIFFISQHGKQSQFQKQLQIQNIPDTIFIYCKQKKLFKLGSLDFIAIQDTINQISNGNRNNFVKYNFQQQLI